MFEYISKIILFIFVNYLNLLFISGKSLTTETNQSMKHLCILLFLGLYFSGSAQFDTSYFKETLRAFSKYGNNNLDSANYYLTKASYIADSVNYNYGKVQVKYSQAVYFKRQGEFKNSINKALEGIELCTEGKSKKLKAELLYLIATTYVKIHDFNEADSYYKIAMEEARRNENKLLVAKIHSTLASMYEIQDNYELSMKHFLTALKEFKKLNATKETSSTFNDLAILLEKMGDYENAIRYLTEGIDYNKKENNIFGLLAKHNTLAGIYNKMSAGEINESEEKEALLDSSLVFFKKAADYAYQLNAKNAQISILLNIGITLNRMSRNEEALEYLNKAEGLAVNSVKLNKIRKTKSLVLLRLNKWDESKNLFKKMEASMHPDEEKFEFLNLYKVGAKIYEVNKEYELAYHYLDKAYKTNCLTNPSIICPPCCTSFDPSIPFPLSK